MVKLHALAVLVSKSQPFDNGKVELKFELEHPAAGEFYWRVSADQAAVMRVQNYFLTIVGSLDG